MSVDFMFGVLMGVVICFIIGHILLSMAHRRLDESMRKTLKELHETAEKIGVPVRVERHDDIFFIYRVKDNSFLAQGANLVEIREAVQNVAKDLHVYIAEGDEDVIQALKNTDPNLATKHV